MRQRTTMRPLIYVSLIAAVAGFVGCKADTPDDAKVNADLRKGMQGSKAPSTDKIPPEARAMMSGSSKPK